jgi:predicted Rossmann fold flavoprotein
MSFYKSKNRSKNYINIVMKKIAIVGGGAAGFFAAIRAAELASEQKMPVEIKIFESGKEFLRKVKISGGGRCNVTHHCFDVDQFCQNYPRGAALLRVAMMRFQAKDTVQWFTKRGVPLVAEADGRMFPKTNRSSTVIDCLMKAAQDAGVICLLEHAVVQIDRADMFTLHFRHGEIYQADVVMLATGSTEKGYALAQSLGHSITERAPSLFSFKIDDPLLAGLAGTSFSNVLLLLQVKKKFDSAGAMLITHWGLSGPAILKLSAWAAREIQQQGDACELTVNWLGNKREDEVFRLFEDHHKNRPNSPFHNSFSRYITKRFWSQLLKVFDISEQQKWGQVPVASLKKLAQVLCATRLHVHGKSRYKDEFVECGGVDLKEIDEHTMQSKLCPGLFFAGELLDVDGITGGFNFQNAWTGGWIAGSSFLAL